MNTQKNGNSARLGLTRLFGAALLAVLLAPASKAAEVAFCHIAGLKSGDLFACGDLVFRIRSGRQELPLNTPKDDNAYGKPQVWTAMGVQRACVTIESESGLKATAFNEQCTKNLATVGSRKAALKARGRNKNDYDEGQDLTSVTVGPDRIDMRTEEWSYGPADMHTYRHETNFHWLRAAGRAFRSSDLFDTSRPTWAADLQKLFENKIKEGPPSPSPERPFPLKSCIVERIEEPARWRFEHDGLALRIHGMFDCLSNTDGGIVTVPWETLRPMLAPVPLIALTGESPETCDRSWRCMD